MGLVILQDQDCRQHVVVGPRIPVVDRPASVKPLPPEIIPFVIGNYRLFHDFILQPFGNQGMDPVKLIFEKEPGPREDVGNLTYAEVNNRFIGIGKAMGRLLCGEMCRPSPPRLFTVEPYAIHDLVDETTFPLGKFSHHKR